MNQNQLKASVVSIFNRLFAQSYRTKIVDKGHEPLYVPASSAEDFHLIYFAHGFWNSALHEIAHWCIAGEERRQLVDYGYWYKPDGRSSSEQALFEKVEAKPQALEWIFTVCIGQTFFLSVDNLSGNCPLPSESFRKNVRDAVLSYLKEGLPERAHQYMSTLLAEFDSQLIFNEFCREIEEKMLLPC